jgi:hypothetical protein
MQYIKYTYVDALTGVPVTDAPAANGPAMPAVDGLEYAWARESAYPTEQPEFFGTCPDESATDVPGVLAVLTQAEWEALHAYELLARNPVPASVTMRQARLALLAVDKLDDVAPTIAAIADSTQRRKAQIEWEFSNEVQRHHGFVTVLAPALGLTDAEIDDLFRLAVTL